MTEEVRRRAACDRCHSQKIRCPRQPGQPVCSRCVKAGTPCVFRPFRQKKPIGEDAGSGGIPTISQGLNSSGQCGLNASPGGLACPNRRRVAPEQNSTAPSLVSKSPVQSLETFNLDEVSLDWLTDQFPQDFVVDSMFNSIDVHNQDPFQSLGGSPMQSGWQVSTPDPNPMVQLRREANLSRSLKNTSTLLLSGDKTGLQSRFGDPGSVTSVWKPYSEAPELGAASDCMQKLSQLSSDLFAHSQTIPPLSIHDPEIADKDGALQVGAKDYSQYVLEDTLRLTQALIEIYPSFLSSFLNFNPAPLPTSDWNGTPPTECSTSSSTGDDKNSPPSLPRSKPPIDHSSILLILSCHLRLIGIYEELFKHMGICIKHRGVALTRAAAMLRTPQLSIGCYRPPPSSAVPMQMLLLIQFSSQLYNYAADLASEIAGLENGNESSVHEAMTMTLTRAAAANVKERAGWMTQELGSMRSVMLHSGMLA